MLAAKIYSYVNLICSSVIPDRVIVVCLNSKSRTSVHSLFGQFLTIYIY